MRAVLTALFAAGPLACGGTTAATAAPPARAGGAAAQTAAGERALEVFAGCRLDTNGQGRFIFCESLAVQISPVPPGDAPSESEILEVAVRQSGKQLDRGELNVDGRRLDIRYVTDLDSLDTSMAITLVARGGERFVAICTQASRTLDRARCAEVFTALARAGIPAALPSVARTTVAVDFQGRSLKLAEPCEVQGPGDLKCSNGQITWLTAPPFPGLDSAAFEAYQKVAASMKEAGASEGDTRETDCKVDGAPGHCKIADWSLGAMGTIRVVFAKASVRQQDTVVVCSYFTDKAPKKLPFPCGALLELP